MTPVCMNPPIGALGAYWGHIYSAQPDEVATLERLAHGVGEAILRIRENPRPAVARRSGTSSDIQPA
jgi:hypothetical protein